MRIIPFHFLTFLFLSLALPRFCNAETVTLMPPDDWPSANWMVTSFGSPSVRGVAFANYQWLEIARTPEEVGSGQVIYTGGSEIESNENQFSDFTGSVIIRGAMGPDGGGVILRAASQKWDESQRYYVAVTTNYDDGQAKMGGIGIYTTDGNPFLYQEGTQSLVFKEASIASKKEYKLLFSANGPVLKAALCQFNTNTSEYDDEIVSVQIDNAEFIAPGWVGLRGGRYGSDNTFIQFRNFEIQVGQPSP